MSQFEAAVKAEVSTSYIFLLEKGEVDTEKMQSRTRKGIAVAYGIDPVTGEPTPELNSTSPNHAATKIPADSPVAAA